MAKSSFEVPEIGTVFVTKNRGQRSVRLRVDTKGQVQISMPWLGSRSLALNFIETKRDWIIQQQSDQHFIPHNGMLFGKTLRLIIMQHNQTVHPKQVGKDLFVYFSGTFDPGSKTHQDKIKKAIMKALRLEAEKVLVPRLKELAGLYNFSYNRCRCKASHRPLGKLRYE